MVAVHYPVVELIDKAKAWFIMRLAMGWVFLWSFLDKLLGLGFSTKPEAAWIAGGSPTFGFLKFGTHGPFAEVFQSLAGNVVVDWLFMIGLLAIGVALILGMGKKIAGYSGSLLFFLMWLAAFPPEHNPLLDDHIIYILILLALTRVRVDQPLGLGKWWANTGLVKRFPILE